MMQMIYRHDRKVQSTSILNMCLYPKIHRLLFLFMLSFLPISYSFQSTTMWFRSTNVCRYQRPYYTFPRRDETCQRSNIFLSLKTNGSGDKMLITQSAETTPTSSSSSSYSGFLVLLSVPLVWGTYVPVVRFLYQIKPPVPGLVFSACYYAVASVTMLVLSRLNDISSSNNNNDNDDMVGIEKDDDSELLVESSSQSESTFPIQGGLELGMYLFIANCLQVIGLETVPSDRAGFLVQLTTVMVPIAEATFAGNLFAVPAQTWGACVLALVGISIMGLDGKFEALLEDNESVSSLLSTALTSFTSGDFLILGAAMLYTMHVVRLSQYAKRTTPIKLAAAKATTEACLSIALVGGLMTIGAGRSATTGMVDGGDLSQFVVKTSTDIANFMNSFPTGVMTGTIPQSALFPALGAVLWTGWVTCAYTIYAQSYGQSRVSPTNANLIYSVQPLFTAFFAWLLLGETMGPSGFLGGAIIGVAVYLVVSNDGMDWAQSTGDDIEDNEDRDDENYPIVEQAISLEEEQVLR